MTTNMLLNLNVVSVDRKPKRYKYTNEINEESLEYYKDELYEIVISFIESKYDFDRCIFLSI